MQATVYTQQFAATVFGYRTPHTPCTIAIAKTVGLVGVLRQAVAITVYFNWLSMHGSLAVSVHVL